MSIRLRATACAALISISTSAVAGDKWAIQPLQVGHETVRYHQGVPTLDLEQSDGVVQVTPLPMANGRLRFGVAVYNDGPNPANFGIENVTPVFETRRLLVLSREQLEKKAKDSAMWGSIGLGLLGAVSAAAAASQRDYYTSSFITPRGTYRSSFSAPSLAGQIQAASISASTGVGLSMIQTQLDRTIVALGDQIVQLSTVNPGESYAGMVVFEKIDPDQLPSRIQLNVNWNGETYPFTFQLAKRGTPPPAFSNLTRPSNLTDFRKATTPSLPAPPTPVSTSIAQSTSALRPRADTLLRASEAAPATGFGNSHVRCVTCRR